MNKFYFVAAFVLLSFGAGAQDFRFGKVSVDEVKEEFHPVDKEVDAAVLYRSHNVYYRYDNGIGFTLVTDVHERIKIYTKEGFDWATKEISYYKNSNDEERVSSIKGYTYNINNGKLTSEKLGKNGIFEEEENDYRLSTKITMPVVQEGSVIEYKYTLNSPFVTSIDQTPLQYTIPINRLEVKIVIPEYLNFRKYSNPKSPLILPIAESTEPFVHLNNNNGRGTSRLQFSQNVYEVATNNVPALKKEDYVDYLHNYAAFLKWELTSTRFPNTTTKNYAEDWESVAKSIFNDADFQKEINRDGYFEDEVDQLVQGVQSPLEKMQLIYKFVKQKVKWNGYYGFMPESGGKSAFKKGEGNVGDINLLLTAMLKYAGLNANPVVLSTRSNGIPVFPTRTGFNYVVSVIEFPEGAVLLDATDPHAAPGELPKRARNWKGRLIRENLSSDWVDLYSGVLSSDVSVLSYELGNDMVLRGKAAESYDGLFAKAYREEVEGLSEQVLLENLEKEKGNIKISEVRQENLDSIGLEVKESYVFELQQGVDVINDKVYIKPFIFNGLAENPFKADERHYPIFFEFPMMTKKTINLLIPEDYEVESLPESSIVQINGGEGEFKFLVKQNGRYLRFEADFTLKNIVFLPEQYTALKEFYAQMVEKQSETLVLKKII